MRTLAELQPDQDAEIASLEGPRPFVRRLMSLGVSPGSRLKVVRFAPLGDPIQVSVGNVHLSIRRNEARQVRLH